MVLARLAWPVLVYGPQIADFFFFRTGLSAIGPLRWAVGL